MNFNGRTPEKLNKPLRRTDPRRSDNLRGGNDPRWRIKLFKGLMTVVMCLALVVPLFTPLAAQAKSALAAEAGPALTAQAKSALAADAAADTTADSREMLDPDRLGSISLTFTYFDEDSGDTFPVTNGNSVGLYKVASAVVDNGFIYEVDERFASSVKIPSTTEELESSNSELAKKLAAVAAKYDFDKQPKKMDSEGKVSFDGLTVGLYLVVQDAKGTGDDEFTIQPFLISVPYRNPDGSLNYDVSGETKPISVVKESSEEKKESDDKHKTDKLPQTGQLWWPVMVLGAAGALLVLAGLVRRYRK